MEEPFHHLQENGSVWESRHHAIVDCTDAPICPIVAGPHFFDFVVATVDFILCPATTLWIGDYCGTRCARFGPKLPWHGYSMDAETKPAGKGQFAQETRQAEASVPDNGAVKWRTLYVFAITRVHITNKRAG